MQARRIVVAKLADVAGSKAPGLAGDDGGGDLAAGLRGPIAVVDFRAGLGKSLERNQGVRGIQADADDINEINGRQISHKNIVTAQ